MRDVCDGGVGGSGSGGDGGGVDDNDNNDDDDGKCDDALARNKFVQLATPHVHHSERRFVQKGLVYLLKKHAALRIVTIP